MLLTFGCYFLCGQSKMAQDENVYCEWKEYLQRSLWEENISKRWSDKLLFFFSSSFCSVSSSFSFKIWLRSKISCVEKLRNNRLNINNKKLCCLTQTGRDVQKSQFLVLCNYWIATNRYQDYLKSHLYSLTLGGLVWSTVISDDLGCL